MSRIHLLLASAAIALGCALAATACGSDVPSEAAVTRTDSAGVALISLPESPWSRSDVPDLQLGEPLVVLASEDPPLFQVSDAAWVVGGIAVANGSSGQVLLFDGSASLDVAIGGQGEGPGKFLGLSRVFAWQGDSIGAFDRRQRRVSFFGSDGRLGRSLAAAGEDNQWVDVRAASTDRLLLVREDQPTGEPGITRPRIHLSVLDAGGSEVAALGDFPGRTVFSNDLGLGGVLMGPGLTFSARSGRVIVADGAVPAATTYEADGRPGRVIRWPDHDRSLESSYFDELLENTLESLPEAAREQGRTALESMPLPDSLPTLGDILLGPDGRIWVGEQPPLETFDPEAPSPPHRWFVLGSDGEVEARLTMPRGVRPVRVDGQRLLVIHRGEDVVETVRAYALPVETARSTGG